MPAIAAPSENVFGIALIVPLHCNCRSTPAGEDASVVGCCCCCMPLLPSSAAAGPAASAPMLAAAANFVTPAADGIHAAASSAPHPHS